MPSTKDPVREHPPQEIARPLVGERAVQPVKLGAVGQDELDLRQGLLDAVSASLQAGAADGPPRTLQQLAAHPGEAARRQPPRIDVAGLDDVQVAQHAEHQMIHEAAAGARHRGRGGAGR